MLHINISKFSHLIYYFFFGFKILLFLFPMALKARNFDFPFQLIRFQNIPLINKPMLFYSWETLRLFSSKFRTQLQSFDASINRVSVAFSLWIRTLIPQWVFFFFFRIMSSYAPVIKISARGQQLFFPVFSIIQILFNHPNKLYDISEELSS